MVELSDSNINCLSGRHGCFTSDQNSSSSVLYHIVTMSASTEVGRYAQGSRSTWGSFRRLYACHGVLRDASLKEIGLALQGNHVHEIEWICGAVVLRIAKRKKQAIGNELDVLTHESRIHTNETNGKRVCGR